MLQCPARRGIKNTLGSVWSGFSNATSRISSTEELILAVISCMDVKFSHRSASGDVTRGSCKQLFVPAPAPPLSTMMSAQPAGITPLKVIQVPMMDYFSRRGRHYFFVITYIVSNVMN